MGPLAHESKKVSVRTGILLLGVHGKLNDVAMILWHTALDLSKAATDLVSSARLVVRLQRAIGEAKRLLASSAAELEKLPLKNSPFYFDQWLHKVEAVHGRLQEVVVCRGRDHMDAARRAVEEASPRWGDSISDVEVNMSAAKIQLVDNPDIKKLPKLVVHLKESMHQMDNLCMELNLPPFKEYEETRERAALAAHAVNFGKNTVMVGAAVSVCVAQNREAMQKVLVHKAVLPKSLVFHIEALLTDSPSADLGGSSASASTATAGASLKRGRSAIFGAASSQRPAEAAGSSGDGGPPKLRKRGTSKDLTT